MPNPAQPTIRLGATGNVVRRLQRALRRTPNPGLKVDGIFGPALETTVKEFQEGAGLVIDGIVGPVTWTALPDGGPMPVLQEGSSGEVVRSLQTLLTNGASGAWGTTPHGIDGHFGAPRRPPYKRFRPGVASQRTEWWETRPGRSRSTQPVRPWKVRLDSNSL
jgi:peptidoglycan hydrolase-like protein with peptidoglycan-binding domain